MMIATDHLMFGEAAHSQIPTEQEPVWSRKTLIPVTATLTGEYKPSAVPRADDLSWYSLFRCNAAGANTGNIILLFFIFMFNTFMSTRCRIVLLFICLISWVPMISGIISVFSQFYTFLNYLYSIFKGFNAIKQMLSVVQRSWKTVLQALLLDAQ